MMTVAQPTPSSKPDKCFYALLHDVPGVLGKLNGDVLFLADGTGALTTVHGYEGLMVLGELGTADSQRSMDLFHGGVAAIACQRGV